MKSDTNTARQATVCVPRILLPLGCDMTKWATVACDQFTSDRAYWDSLSKFVGESPSTLNMMLPECYLGDGDAQERQEKIHAAMREYYCGGLFRELQTFVSVRRTFATGRMRRGLVAAIDLCDYGYAPGNKALIRATEGTVEDRLPPRIKIREESLLEMPHIMLLIDDPKNILFSAVDSAEGEELYNFELNKGGGHIRGNAVKDAESVLSAFDTLGEDMRARFGEDLLLLVGDGNHSLAAAKKCYEKAKAANLPDAELKRYALCEIVNLYDAGLDFEPIHRAAFGENIARVAEKLVRASEKYSAAAGAKCGGKRIDFRLPTDPIDAVAFVQKFLTECEKTDAIEVDYIHGDEALSALGERADCLAIELPPISKSGFTRYILDHGVLPKKTFSMGNAEEKRYYLEARKIGLGDA